MWLFIASGILFGVIGAIVLTTNADRAWSNFQRRNEARGVAAERTPAWDRRYTSGRWLSGGLMLLAGVALLSWGILRLLFRI
ncbi:MAG: hypothetical protein H7Y32_10095 [Chloroflexales bacterium]|nr:hypothetical protein [Chloroflexales bacterium]